MNKGEGAVLHGHDGDQPALEFLAGRNATHRKATGSAETQATSSSRTAIAVSCGIAGLLRRRQCCRPHVKERAPFRVPWPRRIGNPDPFQVGTNPFAGYAPLGRHLDACAVRDSDRLKPSRPLSDQRRTDAQLPRQGCETAAPLLE